MQIETTSEYQTTQESQQFQQVAKSLYQKYAFLVKWPTSYVISGLFMVLIMNCCNGWIIYMGFRNRCQLIRRSPFQALIVNGSLERMLLGVFTYPVFFYWFMVGGPPEHKTSDLCSFAMFSLAVLSTTELCTNALIAFNRVLSCYPNWKISSKLSGIRATLFLITGAWVLCIIVYAIPVLLSTTSWKHTVGCSTIQEYADDLKQMGKMNSKSNVLLLTTIRIIYGFMILGMMLCSICCYALIIRRLFFKESSNVTQISAQRKKDRKRALLIIMLVFVIFLFSWVPLLMFILARASVLDRHPAYIFSPFLAAVTSPLMYVCTTPPLQPDCWRRRQGLVQQQKPPGRKPTGTLSIMAQGTTNRTYFQ